MLLPTINKRSDNFFPGLRDGCAEDLDFSQNCSIQKGEKARDRFKKAIQKPCTRHTGGVCKIVRHPVICHAPNDYCHVCYSTSVSIDETRWHAIPCLFHVAVRITLNKRNAISKMVTLLVYCCCSTCTVLLYPPRITGITSTAESRATCLGDTRFSPTFFPILPKLTNLLLTLRLLYSTASTGSTKPLPGYPKRITH